MTPGALSALCAQLHEILDGPMRREIVEALCTRPTASEAFEDLRRMMCRHHWSARGRSVPLAAGVLAADEATRLEGFHALNDWDGIADHVNPNIIPVDVLDYVRRVHPGSPALDVSLALLIDYYFFHLLSLISLRIWDAGDPAIALQALRDLLSDLQGLHGSGQPFVGDAETLLLIATSHYEPAEHGYDTLLTRVGTLPPGSRCAIALGHAASLGAHLRFGFLATYGRQTTEMRDDNVADYPWLYWSVSTLCDAVAEAGPGALSTQQGQQMVEALLGGLSADTEATLNHPTVAMRLRPLLPGLLPRFAALAPTPETYSPLAVFFNFSHNLIKGTIVDAILRGDPWTVSYNDLLTGATGGRSPLASRQALALVLMDYARRTPQRIRGELLPVIVYDTEAGAGCHAQTMAALERAVTGA